MQVVHYSRISSNKRLIKCKQWSLSSIKVLSVNLNVYTLIISWLNTQWRYHLLFRTGQQPGSRRKFHENHENSPKVRRFWRFDMGGGLKTGVVHNHINALLNYLSCIFLDRRVLHTVVTIAATCYIVYVTRTFVTFHRLWSGARTHLRNPRTSEDI